MLHRTILKAVVAGLLLLSGLACTMAEPQPLTGDQHERHATGIESQVGDI